MQMQAFQPDSKWLIVEGVEILEISGLVNIEVRSGAKSSYCPERETASTGIHRWHSRPPKDLPWNCFKVPIT